jgi:hypothetical protein
MKRRGVTLVELLVLMSLAGAIFGVFVGVFGRDAGGCLIPAASLLSLFLFIPARCLWDSRIALPRLIRRLDHLNETEGKIDREIGRLCGLWVSPRRLEETLLPRLDVDGPCRQEYLEILGRSVGWRPRIQERFRQMAEEPDPLAPRAREILAQHGLPRRPI